MLYDPHSVDKHLPTLQKFFGVWGLSFQKGPKKAKQRSKDLLRCFVYSSKMNVHRLASSGGISFPSCAPSRTRNLFPKWKKKNSPCPSL